MDKAEQAAVLAAVADGIGRQRRITLKGRDVFLDSAALAPPSGKKPAVTPRLREDRVAQRVLRDLETALASKVPAGRTIILTLGAPIKLPAKLVAALTEILTAYLEAGSEERDEKRTILGNRVRFRVMRRPPGWKAKVIGFVFSGDPAPAVIAENLRAMHAAAGAAAKKRPPADFAGDRWLALLAGEGIADVRTYRRAWSHLPRSRAFTKVIAVFAKGRVEDLTEA